MAGKEIVPTSNESSAYVFLSSLSPLREEKALVSVEEPLDVQPLQTSSPIIKLGGKSNFGAGAKEMAPGPSRPTPSPGRPTPPQGGSAPRATTRPLSGGKILKGKTRADTPYKRPTTGTLAPKRALFKGLASEETESFTTGSPRRIIKGVRTPQGYGKVLQPPLTAKDKRVAESVDSSPGSKRVRRTLSLPPIKRPGGHFESSEEKSPKPNLLSNVIKNLREESKRLGDELAEVRLEFADLKDDFRVLRRGLNAKMSRFFKAAGKGEHDANS